MDFLQGIDWGNYVHWQARQIPWVQHFCLLVNYLGGYLVSSLIVLLALVWFLGQGQRRTALLAGVFVLIGVGLVEGLRVVVGRPRPPESEHWLGLAKVQGSFPSGTIFLATMAWGLLLLAAESAITSFWGRWGLRGAVTAFLMLLGFCPLYLGLHYLSDEVASWALAGVFLIYCRHFAGSVPPPQKGMTP